MIIFQVDARVSAMGKEDIEQELKVLGEVFVALDGELIGAEVGMERQLLVAYVRAESELVVGDVFEASLFPAEQIVCLGWAHEAHVDLDRPASQGAWRYRPAQPAGPQAAARLPAGCASL
jgi:hypothetical protein